MNNSFYNNRKKKGYTLAEVLTTVMILLILMAIAVPAIFSIRNNMRQKALDSKAELIYTAVQNNLVKLQNNGNSSKYAGDKATPVTANPSDADGDKRASLYYVISANKANTGNAASVLVTADTLDAELYNNYWVVEYNPESASVYAVFYSETRSTDDYNTGDYNALRDKKARLRNGAEVGYYGGDMINSGSTSTLAPTLTITNEEKLTATISCKRPDTNDLLFEVTLEDGKGNNLTLKYKVSPSGDTLVHQKDDIYTEGEQLKENETGTVRGIRYTLTLDLDALSEDGSLRFNKLYGQENNNITNISHRLVAGTTLTITAKVKSAGAFADSAVVTDTTNSLFADESTGNQAVIKYGRHLQNLDQASGVVADITSAVQQSDIHFEKQDDVDDGDTRSWYSCYKDMTFTPITNENLTSYSANYRGESGTSTPVIYHLTVKNQENAGLFGTLTDKGMAIEYVKLSGAEITGNNGEASSAGAIAGKAKGEVALNNCQIFLSKEDVAGKTEADYWITGAAVQGGLIGTADGKTTIDKSFAATVMGSESAKKVGGLVGVANGNITVTNSYTDSYLTGEMTGGLIASSPNYNAVQIISCYTAGYQMPGKVGAGLVAEGQGTDVHAENCYSAVKWINNSDNSAENQNEKIMTYSLGPGTAKNSYFLNGGTDYYGYGADNFPKEQGEKVSYNDLSNKTSMKEKLGNAFVSSAVSTNAYNLKNQGLTGYSYPALADMPHYGDWEANFEPGSLVYYEAYQDGTYGFFGGNITSTLSDSGIVGDGYGIAYEENSDIPKNGIQITYQSGADKYDSVIIDTSATSATYYTVEVDKKTYHIYPLPVDVVNAAAISGTYYQKLTIQGESAVGVSETGEEDTATDVVSGGTYYYNPHFAKTAVNAITAPTVPEEISIRTARQLYHLSLYYPDYAEVLKNSTFMQEVDVDYAVYGDGWSKYAGVEPVTVQESIGVRGTQITPFISIYDGNCHEIRGISFSTNATAVGFIAQNGKTIRNVFLVSDYNQNGSNPYLKYQGTISVNKTVYMGTLAGINSGRIQNCAVSGYSISGTNKVYVRSNGTFYFGGLTGSNRGTIVNCEADTPLINSEVLYGNAYIAGFAGENASGGIIRNSYAIGHVMVEDAKGGATAISGFTSRNAGSLNGDYSAVVLTASGSTTKSYGFAPQGGSINANCSYLSGGTFRYLGELYAFDNTNGAGTKKNYKELVEAGGNVSEGCSYWHEATGTSEDNYPFKAVVTKDGKIIHYGNWELTEDLGAIGIVYWELEQGGSNDGYHFSYIGYQGEGTDTLEKIGGSTLCQQHDDGGVVTQYGYGYYFKSVDESDWSENNALGQGTPDGEATYFKTGAVNTDASIALSKRLPGFTVVAYRTKPSIGNVDSDDYMRMTAEDRSVANGIWKFTYQSLEYTFTINPFFANAMEYGTATDSGVPKSLNVIEDGVAVQVNETYDMPGTSSNCQYEIRSDNQLQYMNWNCETQDAVSAITGTKTGSGTSAAVTVDTKKVEGYTYLGYMYTIGEVRDNNNRIGEAKYLWKQSHDVDADMTPNGTELFTPIGSLFDTNGDAVGNKAGSAYAYMSYLNGSYNGNTYSIKNIEINSQGVTIGLFGGIIGANVSNIVLYSDKGNYIQRRADSPKCWYVMGGLCGMVGVGQYSDAGDIAITNCTVSGYTIQDNSTRSAWGDACIGGMFGMSTMDLKQCTAVNDIILNTVFVGWGNSDIKTDGVSVRTGGLVGSMRGNISSCYTGGEISITKECQANAVQPYGSKIFLGGITGGICMKSGNFLKLLGKSVKGVTGWDYDSDGYGNWQKCKTVTTFIYNCYTYIKMPSTKDALKVIKSIEPIGSNGETPCENSNNYHVKILIRNCYYYDLNMPAENLRPKFRVCDHLGYDKNNPRDWTNIDSDAMAISWKQLAGQEMINGKELTSLLTELPEEAKNENLTIDKNFETVTISENGQSVDGKYTFPGDRTYLEGENFPFPTILKQEDSINVHYGEWPLEGIYWEESRATMDIFEDLQLDENSTSTDDTGWAVKEFKLLDPVPVLRDDLTFDKFTFTYSNGEDDTATEAFSDNSEETAAVFSDGFDSSEDADGFSSGETEATAVSTAEAGTEEEPGTVELSGDDLIAQVTAIRYDNTSKCYVATVRALKTGATIITVTAKDDENNEYRASFNLSVSADLSVQADPDTVELNVNESKEVTVHGGSTAAISGSSAEAASVSEVGQAADSDGWGAADSTEEFMVSEGVAGMEVFASDTQTIQTDLASRMKWTVENGDEDLVECTAVTNGKFTVTSRAVLKTPVVLTITGTYTYNNTDYSAVTWAEVTKSDDVEIHWQNKTENVTLESTDNVIKKVKLMDESGCLAGLTSSDITIEPYSESTTYTDESSVMVQNGSLPEIKEVAWDSDGYMVTLVISSSGEFKITAQAKGKNGKTYTDYFILKADYSTSDDQQDSTNEIISSDTEQTDPGFTSDGTDSWADQGSDSVDMVPDQNNASADAVPDQSTDDFSDESSGWES